MSLEPSEFRKEITMFHGAIDNLNKIVPTLQEQNSRTDREINTLYSSMAEERQAHKAQIDKLQKQLDDNYSRQQTQKAETDSEIRQLKDSVHKLTVANKELLELVALLTARFNEMDLSNSFFGSSRASEVDPSEIDEKLNKALSNVDVNDQNF